MTPIKKPPEPLPLPSFEAEKTRYEDSFQRSLFTLTSSFLAFFLGIHILSGKLFSAASREFDSGAQYPQFLYESGWLFYGTIFFLVGSIFLHFLRLYLFFSAPADFRNRELARVHMRASIKNLLRFEKSKEKIRSAWAKFKRGLRPFFRKLANRFTVLFSVCGFLLGFVALH